MDRINKQGVSVMKVYAPWCGPCKQLTPLLEQARQELGFQLVEVDGSAEVELAQHLQVRTVPTLIVFKDGQEVSRASGLLTLDGIKALVG